MSIKNDKYERAWVESVALIFLTFMGSLLSAITQDVSYGGDLLTGFIIYGVIRGIVMIAPVIGDL
ncbi:hypothetical protein [Vibrio phage RYC]|nr:hypothetical protein [Vibrio phage RYC]